MYGLFTFIWLIFREHVRKYTSPTDGMGMINPSESWESMGAGAFFFAQTYGTDLVINGDMGPLQMAENTWVTWG